MNEAIVVFVRGIIGFFTLLILTRILGKQQLSQLTYFEYVLGITIGSIAASLTTDLSSRAWPHWIGLVTWAGAVFILQLVTSMSKKVAKYIDGDPTIVIMNGKIMESAMRKMRYRAADLMVQLRNKDIFDLAEVEFAILETNGQLSVLKKPQHLPLTPKDMSIPTTSTGLSIELIYSGKIIDKNLKKINRDLIWLKNQLKMYEVSDPSQVFLATINGRGELYVNKYKDNLKNHTEFGD